jgi:endonuclease-3
VSVVAGKPAGAASLSPREIIGRLSEAYGEREWRSHGDAVTELVLTILSQNTSDTNSGRAFMRLRARFPAWDDVMDAPPEEIEAAIAVGGLARVKAPRIKAVLPEAKEWLRSLPGVGPKTAACVLMFALGLPVMPVDTHVHRVSMRLGLVPAKATAEQAHDLLEALLDPAEVYPLHILLIKHGRRLCRARRPLCGQCPLMDACPFGQAELSAHSD